MSGRVRGLGIAAAVLVSTLLSLAPARAANWLEMNFWMSGPRYDAVVPGCEAALPWIVSRFSEKEGHYWNSELQITGFERVRETAFMPWAQGTIPRRYCSATAFVTDGHKHHVSYSIAEDAGVIGATWGVDFCVVGLDRNWAYNPRCKMARP
ncbi:MAG TPA: hypothetical protein VFB45_24530 [Pseudolabrys sp.]|nr:hypothetical protein [Pseudolabrys sp.]